MVLARWRAAPAERDVWEIRREATSEPARSRNVGRIGNVRGVA
jgi:hypothetical protein